MLFFVLWIFDLCHHSLVLPKGQIHLKTENMKTKLYVTMSSSGERMTGVSLLILIKVLFGNDFLHTLHFTWHLQFTECTYMFVLHCWLRIIKTLQTLTNLGVVRQTYIWFLPWGDIHSYCSGCQARWGRWGWGWGCGGYWSSQSAPPHSLHYWVSQSKKKQSI